MKLISTITLRPTVCEQLSLDELDAVLIRLCEESRTAQRSIIDEVAETFVKPEVKSKFSNTAARSLPNPDYPTKRVETYNSREIDKAEAYRLLLVNSERRKLWEDIHSHNSVTYSDFKKLYPEYKYLKLELFKNLQRCTSQPRTIQIKTALIPINKAGTQYCQLEHSSTNIRLINFALLDQRVDINFELPESVLKVHIGKIIKISRPTIRICKHSSLPVFDFAIIEEYPDATLSTASVIGVDLGKSKVFAAVRVYTNGDYSQPLSPSRELERLHQLRVRDEKELRLKREKDERRRALGVINENAAQAIRELADKQERRSTAEDWLVARDLCIHAEPGETIVFERLNWTSGESHFRHAGIQQSTEHRGVKVGHLVKKVNAANTSQNCPRCPGAKLELTSDRQAVCSLCGWTFDRDDTAAFNIGRRALKQPVQTRHKKNRATPKRPKTNDKRRAVEAVADPVEATVSLAVNATSSETLSLPNASRRSHVVTPLRL